MEIAIDQIRHTFKHGHRIEEYYLYGLDRRGTDPSEYITEEYNLKVLGTINAGWRINHAITVSDKCLFSIIMHDNHMPIPATWGLLCKGNLFIEGDYATPVPMEALLQNDCHLLCKPIRGYSGLGILSIYVKDGQIHVMPSILRIGTGESIVDNTSQGGLAVGIDTKTGYLKQYGFYKPAFGREVEENGKVITYFKEEEHPDSHIRFAEFQVPYFSEAVRQAKYYHSMMPSLHSVGWDIAIGENGPIFIEGNENWEITGPQTCNGGLKKEFEEYFFE